MSPCFAHAAIPEQRAAALDHIRLRHDGTNCIAGSIGRPIVDQEQITLPKPRLVSEGFQAPERQIAPIMARHQHGDAGLCHIDAFPNCPIVTPLRTIAPETGH